MANNFYDKGRQKILDGSIAFITDTIKCALIDSSYTPNLATHEFWSDINAHVVGTPVALSSKTDTTGIAGCAAVVFPTTSGSVVGYLAFYKDTGVAGTSPLIALFDTLTGLPYTPSGGDITFTPASSQLWKV